MIMSATQGQADAQLLALYTRVLGGELGAAHLWFEPAVLERYRALAGGRVMRTNTVGRVQSPDGWSLDFGIAPDDVLHATVSDVAQRLPASERQHWLQHMVAPAVSRNFLTMRLVPGSCIDDGELRTW
jgi:hypothetical protein